METLKYSKVFSILNVKERDKHLFSLFQIIFSQVTQEAFFALEKKTRIQKLLYSLNCIEHTALISQNFFRYL